MTLLATALNLAEVLGRLEVGEYVIVEDGQDSSRYVQACRDVDALTVEVSGPRAHGGPADLSAPEQAALAQLGLPDPQTWQTDAYPNYRVRLDPAFVAHASWLLVNALVVIAKDFSDLRRTRSHFDLED